MNKAVSAILAPSTEVVRVPGAGVRFGFFAVLLACLCAGPVHAAWYWPLGQKGMAYDVGFSGVDDETYRWFKKLGLDERNTANPPETNEQLAQELMVLASKVKQALDAHGYYDAVIQPKVSYAPARLDYAIVPGPRYTLRSVTLDWQGPAVKGVSTSLIASAAGKPVDAASIQDDAARLEGLIAKDTCFLSLDVKPVLTLYGTRHVADLSFAITHGPAANFGPTTISGTERVNDKVILRNAGWKQGECFKRKPLEDARTALIQNQLFSSVQVRPARVPDEQGEVPVTIRVRERAARTLSAGLEYNTDEGFTVNGGWEHRNLWGNAEKFTADTSFSAQQQTVNTALRLPDFGRKDQTLVLTAGTKHEDRDAYLSTSFNTGAALERKLTNRLTGSLGVAYTLAHTEDILAGKSDYGLISFPGSLNYDARDNVLDSRHGVLANLSATPYAETFGEGGNFIKTQVTGQTYLSSNMTLSPTLALKASAGTIMGAKGKDIPSDIRFYAGGGGSVRGYGYQTLGPRSNSTAIGGNSFMTASAETRLRFTENVGGVVFADAGNVFADEWPKKTTKLYTSAGVGLRYYTALGPLRADLAFPMNGRDIGAPSYAVYVSIGQSF